MRHISIFIFYFLFITFIYCNNDNSWINDYKEKFYNPTVNFIRPDYPILSTSEIINDFTEWIDNNYFKRNFDIEEIPNQGIGGIAKKQLSVDDYLLKVPKSKMIFAKEVYSINNWSDWNEDIQAQPLIIWLLRENLNKDSFWNPYLNIIPRTFEGHPMTWPSSDFDYAKDSDLSNHQQNIFLNLLKSYKHLLDTLITEQPDLFPENYFTWDNYLWGFLAVTTRSWLIEEDEKSDLALIPLADILNHQDGCAIGGMVGKKQFVIDSTQEYSKGDQVFDSYGEKTNYDLLISYGFILDNNIYNGAKLKFNLNPQDIIHKQAQKYLGNRNSLIIPQYGEPKDLIRIFRMNALGDNEVHLLSDIMHFKSISTRNDLTAYNSIIQHLDKIIKSLRSKEELLELLDNPSLTTNQKTTIKLQLTDQQIYQQTKDLIIDYWNDLVPSEEHKIQRVHDEL